MALRRKATEIKPFIAYKLQRKQVDASTGHKDMDPISKSSALSVAKRNEKNSLVFKLGKGLVWTSL